MKKIDSTNAPAIIKQLLESSWALPSIDDGQQHERVHDDHDGTYSGILGVMRSDVDGDMYVWTYSDPHRAGDWLRFRTAAGGGASLRTHNALRILAEAIRLDAIDNPRRPPGQRSG